MSESHDRKSKRILERDWHKLREKWIEYIPQITEPGIAPSSGIEELPQLSLILGEVPKQQVKDVPENIPGLRSSVLHEGIFLLHKAAHVLGAACVHVSQGMCTWSLSSAYQSAFFAMKSVLNLLGVAVIESSSRYFLIDVWATPPKSMKRTKWPIIFIGNTDRIEQRNMWGYFKRTLEMTRNCDDCCMAQLRAFVLSSEISDFARQRNVLHYKSEWCFNDLHACLVQEGFGRIGDSSFELGQSDLPLRMAFGLVRMGRMMLSQLAESSLVLKAEVSLIDTWLAAPFNDLYRDNLLTVGSVELIGPE